MFSLRAIRSDDLKQVLSLAKLLAAVNLSGQPEDLQKQIQQNQESLKDKKLSDARKKEINDKLIISFVWKIWNPKELSGRL